MKNKLLSLVLALTVVVGSANLFACDFKAGNGQPPNYNENIQIVAPENITNKDLILEEGETYYTSNELSLWMEVNGHFLEMDYFYLDGNKRVYDNMYFYERDYFYMLTDDLRDIYASLSDASDSEYAEEEKESGYDIQINIKKEGIYKLIFDVDTLKFDLEYKAEIQTPVYYTMKNCSIYSKATQWVNMSVNPDNQEEFVIKNFYIDACEYIGFYNSVHTSNYKVTLDESCNETYADSDGALVSVNIGGNYDIYVNSKTYVVRLELLNPDTATYTCVYYNGSDFVELQPYEVAVPYIFRMNFTVEKKYRSVPDFHTLGYRTYKLKVLPADFLMNDMFIETGEYVLIINLKTFEIGVEVLPS